MSKGSLQFVEFLQTYNSFRMNSEGIGDHQRQEFYTHLQGLRKSRRFSRIVNPAREDTHKGGHPQGVPLRI